MHCLETFFIIKNTSTLKQGGGDGKIEMGEEPFGVELPVVVDVREESFLMQSCNVDPKRKQKRIANKNVHFLKAQFIFKLKICNS